MSRIFKIAKLCILSGIAGIAMTVPSWSGGDFRHPPRESRCDLSANAAVTSDYVSRGYSQTQEDAAVQLGLELTCGMFYAGIWGSNVDYNTAVDVEVDIYAGIRREYYGVTYDLGLLYYAYDGNTGIDTYEVKAGVSADIVPGSRIGLTAFWDFDQEIYTYEGLYTQTIRKIGPFTPKFSAMLGTSTGDGLIDDYVFWHAGVGLGFAEYFELDLRYYDSDVSSDTLADERFVVTLSAQF